MYNLLLVDSEAEPFAKLEPAIRLDNRVVLATATSGNDALRMALEKPCDLVLVDEMLVDMTGLEFVAKLVSRDPTINCALISSLDDGEFHQASEGLGILATLPPYPDVDQLDVLLDKLNAIL